MGRKKRPNQNYQQGRNAQARCKNEKTSDNIIDIYIPGQEESIIEQFETYIKEDTADSTGDLPVGRMLQFIGMKNAEFLAKSKGQITPEYMEDLCDFYDYFMDNYGEETFQERMAAWGCEPLIFRAIDELYEQAAAEIRNDYLNNLPKDLLKRATELRDKLFSIRKDKYITCSYIDEEGEMCSSQLLFERYIPREALQEAKSCLLFLCACSMEYAGGMTVRICAKKNQPDRIFGIQMGRAKWESISAEVMRDAHQVPEEIKDGTPDVIYTTMEAELGA